MGHPHRLFWYERFQSDGSPAHVFRVPLPDPVGVGMIRVAHEAAGAVAVCAGNGLTR
jgi:hypothetical protein